ncbi:MAG: PAS domain-containing sensor histidine kinase [Pseudomonadota bacterium]
MTSSNYMTRAELIRRIKLLEQQKKVQTEQGAGIAPEPGQRKMEEALRESEARYQRLLETANEGVWTVNAGGRIEYVNRRGAQMLGYSPEEILGRPLLEFVVEDDAWKVAQSIQVSEQGGFAGMLEFRMRRKDNAQIWVCANTGQKNAHPGMLMMCSDITETKRAYEELKVSHEELHELSSRLLSAREEERSRIAREIHDELGATLTAIKMNLGLCAKLPERSSKKRNEHLAAANALIDVAMQAVSKIATDLRPSILDNAGLWAALEWQTQTCRERMGIPCELDMEVDDMAMDRDQASAIFRIFQEALTNVARHAEATRVHVKVRADDKEVVVEINDNGKGITPSDMLKEKSWGVMGMRERARSYGGELAIGSTTGQGTTITLYMPLRKAK